MTELWPKGPLPCLAYLRGQSSRVPFRLDGRVLKPRGSRAMKRRSLDHRIAYGGELSTDLGQEINFSC